MLATVTVPATAANLGPGFDVFGMALELVNRVTVDTNASPAVTWQGEGADELAGDGSDLVSVTVGRIAARMGAPLPGYALHGEHRIPLERGLGSSSAATVTGVVVASLLLGLGWERDPWTVFAAAAEIEGHPDNAAPSVFGGFTIAMPDGFVHRRDLHPDLHPVAIVPATRLATGEARAALPAQVARADAVFNVAHAALAVEAFTTEPALLHRALADRLHEDVRIELAGMGEVAEALRAARIPFCVSGAGPTLLAFELDGSPPLLEASLGLGAADRVLRLDARAAGFTVEVHDG